MAEGRAEVTIGTRSADEVWKLVGDFGGIAGWMPGIEACDVDGDVRTIKTMGIEVKEALRTHDDASRTVAYSIVEAPMPVEHHLATITVEPAGSGAKVTWDVEVRPDEMLDVFVPIYQQSLDALKKSLEG